MSETPETPEHDEPMCFLCRFWFSGDTANEGKCHRNPPVLVPILMDLKLPRCEDYIEAAQSAFSWEQPWTYATDWCGEHQPK